MKNQTSMKLAIKFTEQLFQAIEDGYKTQTRRLVDPEIAIGEVISDASKAAICPYGQVGDVILANSVMLLEITQVKAERLNDISEEDAKHEGVQCLYLGIDDAELCKAQFADLWEEIYGTDAWDSNPWVWVITFKVLGHEN